MEKQIQQVMEFQKASNAPIPERPTLLPLERAELRMSLINEEVKEIEQGVKESDMTLIADGIIDSMYILIGTAIEYGLADRLIHFFDEVHRSNMSKCIDGKMKFREDGKVLKPDTYSPPNIDKILQRDFEAYRKLAVEMDALKIDEGLYNIFMDKVKSTIYHLLEESDRRMFKRYNKLEKELESKINISIDYVDGLHKADVKVYEYKVTIWE